MAEFKTSPIMTVQMPVMLNANGTLAQSGETVSGKKNANVPGIKRDATLAQSVKVYDAFYGTIGGASFDSISAVRKISEGVEE